MSDRSENLRDQLTRLDADYARPAVDSVELTACVVRLRNRKRAARRVTTGAVLCAAIVCGVFFMAPPSEQHRGDRVVSRLEQRESKEVESSANEVENLKRELAEFRQQSQHITQLLAKLDTVIQRQLEIDRRLDEVERQSWEASIRMNQSESLAIDVSYDFGY